MTSGRFPDIAGFAFYTTFTPTTDWENPQPWGIASLESETPTAIPQPTATPEPATLLLAGLGLAVVGVRRRRAV